MRKLYWSLEVQARCNRLYYTLKRLACFKTHGTFCRPIVNPGARDELFKKTWRKHVPEASDGFAAAKLISRLSVNTKTQNRGQFTKPYPWSIPLQHICQVQHP